MQQERDKILEMLMAAKGGGGAPPQGLPPGTPQQGGPPQGLPMAPDMPGMNMQPGMEMGPPPSTMPEQPLRPPAPIDNIQPPPVGVDSPPGLQAAAQRRATPNSQDAAKDFVRSILGRGGSMPGMQ